MAAVFGWQHVPGSKMDVRLDRRLLQRQVALALANHTLTDGTAFDIPTPLLEASNIV